MKIRQRRPIETVRWVLAFPTGRRSIAAAEKPVPAETTICDRIARLISDVVAGDLAMAERRLTEDGFVPEKIEPNAVASLTGGARNVA